MSAYKSFENTVGKEENSRYEQILLFAQCFLVFRKTSHRFAQVLNCGLQTLSVCECLKFVVLERVIPPLHLTYFSMCGLYPSLL